MNQPRHITRYANGSIASARRVNGSMRRPGMAGPPDDAKINLTDVLDALHQGKWIILLSCLLITAAMVVYTKTIAPTYQARSVVFINTGPSLAPGVVGSSEPHTLANELGILQQSAELANRVAQRIQSTAAAVGTAERFPILNGTAGDSLHVQPITARLLEQVQFRPSATQDMIEILAESTTPEEAALIANEYAEEYVKFNRESSRASIAAKKAFLQQQVAERRRELDDIEGQWEDYAQEKHIVTLGTDGERLVSDFVELKAQRDNAAFQLGQEKHSLEILKRELERVEPGLVAQLTTTRETASLESRINALNEQISTLEVQAGEYYAVNPNIKGKESSIQALSDINKKIQFFKGQREALTQQLVSQTSTSELGEASASQMTYVVQLKNKVLEKNLTVRELQNQVAALDGRLGGYRGSLQSIPRQIIETKQLEQQRTIAEQWYMTFLQELQKTMIAEEAELGSAKIVRSAIVPTLPVRPDLKQNLMLGLLLGLGIGVALAFAKKAMSHRLQQPDELEQNGYNLIGVIPSMDKAIAAHFMGKDEVEKDGKTLSTRLITLHDPWSPISESYRLVRTNIGAGQTGLPTQVLLVTSPEMSDGKTVTALNLAIAAAQFGHRTLLIDADMRRPTAHRLLNVSPGCGLAEMLSGRREGVEPQPTIVRNLWLIPAGSATSPPAEVIGSNKMFELLEQMRAAYDLVIVDSPPVLAVTDAVLLAPLCDATVMVVSAHRTDVHALDVTKKMLAAVGVPIAGTIFNRFDAQKAGGYRYGFGYGYSKYTYGYQQAVS
ncbi:MAG TPA: polysaccharide biosynthesis tyrosine autokinase [Rhodothermales bacterium]|nr:polysaccharide biosynthesis tyrosine autokinase [Rhodothermales bacterium]